MRKKSNFEEVDVIRDRINHIGLSRYGLAARIAAATGRTRTCCEDQISGFLDRGQKVNYLDYLEIVKSLGGTVTISWEKNSQE